MANDKRFIVKNGLRADNVEFTDSQDGSNQITLNMLNTDTLNFEGDAGSLFSISDDLTGTVFSVGDISGIPIIEANGDTHNVTFNEFDGKVMIGGTDSGSTDSDVLNVTGNVRATAYYGDGSNLTGIAASGGVDSAAVSSIISNTDIDADTLAGVNSTSFLRSDAADAFSGKLDATGTIEFAGGTTFDPTVVGTGTDTATDVGIALTSGTRIVGTSNGYIRTLLDWTVSSVLDIGQSGTTLIQHVRIFGGTQGVELYENGTKRIETTPTGATVTGTMSATTFSGSGSDLSSLPAAELTGTVSDARLPASISSDITGNAATATSLATARNIDVTGVTATGVNFDGTGDIDIEVTAVPSSLLTGTIDSARLPVIASANDAGTLDGINSTSFLRSDAADTKTSGNLVFNDGIEAQFGTGNDLRIYHDATFGNGVIRENGSGNLVIGGDNILLRNAALNELKAQFTTDGAVELYYDNNKKFETTSTGATVTGTLIADGLDIARDTAASAEIGRAHIGNVGFSDFAGFSHVDVNATGTYALLQSAAGQTLLNAASGSNIKHRINNVDVMTMDNTGLDITGDLTLTSTDSGATENPTIDLYRNSASPADNDVLGHIHFSGENDADQKVIYNEIESRLLDASDGTEDGRFVINTMTAGTFQTHYATGFGFNQFYKAVLLAQDVNLQFEGATNDGVRTTLTVADPTSARTITFPDATGTVALTSDITAGGLDSAGVLTIGGLLRSDVADTKTSGTLSFSDTVTLDFGAGVDLRLRSNGTNGYIEQTSGNSIVYKSGGHSFRNAADTEQLAKFTENSSVELYHDNSKKFETTSTGVTVTGLLSATTKSFDIEHPTEEGKRLRYGSLEGPENGVYVRGRLKGDNRIQLPDHWTGLVDEDTITVNLTPIGNQQSLFVEDIINNEVLIGGCRKHVDAWDINCFYTVYGERKDVDQLVVEYDA